ncbi:MAG: ATP-binding protein [Acidimicrobiales bacterium]
MRLRLRLVVTMIVVVALGLAAVDVITLTSLHSALYGRVDDQLETASDLVARYVVRAQERGLPVTAAEIQSRVSPEIFVELLDRGGTVLAQDDVHPAPHLPHPLPVDSGPGVTAAVRAGHPYDPDAASVNVTSVTRHGPEYRLLATSVAGQTLVVATSLASVNSTLGSLRAIELALSLGLLVALLLVTIVLVRLGLRPLEDMARDADAIAAGDLTRRVQPVDGNGEIARLGRALNGMLAQIETAFTQRARSEERLRSFLADASHELRTPLTSIRGYAELLRKEALADGASRDRALSRIEKEAGRMGALVGDLAVLAREGEGPEPARSRVDLAAVAADVVADARTVDPGHTIGLQAPDEVPVAGDDARLEQLVHNLIGNALVHTPPGTPVDVAVTAEGDRCILEVRDQGPGMDADQASRVFDRFYRGDAERLDGGSGLGLFIVASLARTFGGRATVETAPGEGSTFRVVLPRYGCGPWADGTGDGSAGLE